MVRAIGELQDRGIEPDVWKVECLNHTGDCARVSVAARQGGRDQVACVLLGAGAPQAVVERWLLAAADTPGYIGFAIGRPIWWDALDEWISERLEPRHAATKTAGNYKRVADLYTEAATSGPAPILLGE